MCVVNLTHFPAVAKGLVAVTMQLPTASALVIAFMVRLGLADLPVHCLRHQVAGDWEFTLGPLGPKRSSCGHRKPDDPNQQPHMKFLEQQGQLTKRRMSLQDPNIATNEEGTQGTWTMIYDEGFEVAMADLVYLAFSKFTFTDGPEGQNNISHCGETEIGWYHDTARSQWGCYIGRKVDAVAEDTVGPTTPPAQADTVADTGAQNGPALALEAFGSSLDVASPVDDDEQQPQAMSLSSKGSTVQSVGAADEAASTSAQDGSSADSSQQEKALQDLYTEPADYKPWVPSSAGFDKPMQENWQQSVTDALNFLQLGWTASAYEQFKGKTPRELNRFAGVRRSRPHPHAKAPGSMTSSPFTSFLGMASRHRRIHRSSFNGDDFDWRNKDGTNFLEPVVTQGDCGSCYTIATVHMLTARNRIRVGSTSEPSFSVSFPLYCSEYNQGCDGGYGFLQSKWNEDVGLVPASCLPFSQGGGKCKISPNCDLGSKRYRAQGHHYVGGYYGGSDADAIKHELVERGPLVMSFEPKEDFMYYKTGVYRSGPNKIHQEWEQVDHAVLLAGFGVDGDQAYWTLQNSWGTDWGETGYFRMARGTDESGCESIAVAADTVEESTNPVLDDFIAQL